ncbi:hypothetical protein SAY87_007886 [Trapa incisa]|uniref:Uncharacterized protein n=1 Tax=Trapa incisa TaxID=236973 RepID=A0AAN7KJA6_9MYRT|nr:hypothetical protein SAY87_007886 [Trapa incisa]
MQGASLKASMSGETLPHSLVPLTPPEVTKMLRAKMNSRAVEFQPFTGVSMSQKIVVVCNMLEMMMVWVYCANEESAH